MAVALHSNVFPSSMGPVCTKLKQAKLSQSSLAIVNDDLLNAVTSFLSVEDVLAVGQTSRGMRISIRDHTNYWSNLELMGATTGLLMRLLPFVSAMRCVRILKSSASTEAWIHFAKSTQLLTVINISGSKYVTDDVFELFCERNSSTLMDVSADNCSWISTLSPLLPFAKSLRAMSFNRCRQLLTNDILEVVQNAPNLVSLELKGNPKVSPPAIVTTALAYCPTLKVLTLGGSGRYTKDVNLDFYQAFTQQNQSYPLECLDLSCSNPFGSRSPLADEGLIPLLNLCPNLNSLFIKGHSNLSGVILTVLPPNLVQLDISGCSQITSNLSGIIGLAKLEVLIMYACENITDNIMYTLKQTNPNLIKVDVEACPAVTDAGRMLFSS
ncbi:hypothetical protein THRCLA_00393 [Thraustotheca clavata]|uniref:F-box domain-containing protein n=1 Tax=Thraustotheca clavata TaxID=74557 RepID=A0A1W0ABF1_9STRA|nr:hypothetical protein THRCLA_00393 [Thraustotheca clavata]